MSILINLAAEFTGKKAFDKADKSVVNLEKSAKKLAKTLGYSLSAAAVVAFGKASVKAFAEDEKAATRLAGVLDNLGLSFANPQIATFIEDLSKASSVTDDQLRPAFQALITTTGSLTNSQKLLTQAIDISAGSGVDLATVANDLAQAYVGNTKGLRKYNLGLSQAELKAASFADIQTRLTELFSGSNAKYLETYAGKMQLLTTAAGEAQETIGQGLVDVLMALGGDTSVQELATDMQNVAQYTADTVRGIGLLVGEIKKIPGFGVLGDLLKAGFKTSGLGALITAAQKKGATKQSTGFSFFGSPMETTQNARNAKAAKAAEAAAAKRAKALTDAQKKNTAELKKQAALKKAGSIFDLEQIQIIAALKGNISKDEKLRLELQLALIQGNEDYAKKLSEQLALSQYKAEGLTFALNNLPKDINPFKAWITDLDTIEARIRALNLNPSVTPSPSSNVPVMPIASPDAVLAQASADFAAANQQIRIVVEGGDEVTSLMRFKIQEAAQSGSTTNWSQTVGAWDR
jgi:hypothetical protein